MTLTPAVKAMLQLGAVLAVLAAAGLLATVGDTLTGGQVYSLITVIAGGTAVAGGLALSPSTTTTNLLPHIVLILAVLALTVCLALKDVFGSTEVQGVFGFIIGGGAVGAGTGIFAAKVATQAPPPPSPPAINPARGGPPP